jgi:hypothetical protein
VAYPLHCKVTYYERNFGSSNAHRRKSNRWNHTAQYPAGQFTPKLETNRINYYISPGIQNFSIFSSLIPCTSLWLSFSHYGISSFCLELPCGFETRPTTVPAYFISQQWFPDGLTTTGRGGLSPVWVWDRRDVAAVGGYRYPLDLNIVTWSTETN